MLKLDLQFFGFDPFGEIDLDAIDEEIVETEEEIVDTEEVEEVEEVEETEELEESTDEKEVEDPAPDISKDDDRNRAFAELRRERDRLAKDAEFIQKIADQNGISVEQLRAQYEEDLIAKEAEAKGVPVDVIKRLNTLEQENLAVKQQAQAAQFNAQVEATMAKYNGTQEDFNNVAKYAQENGLKDAMLSGAVTFEAVYKLANLDTMLESAKKSAVQEDLATRKKRQQEAPVATTGASAPVISQEEELDALVDKDVEDILGSYSF